MKTISYNLALAFLLISFCACKHEKPVQDQDPLPSWNETPIKKSIIEYMNKAVAQIPVEDRIAVFDMDGTLACETPLWFEMYAAVNGLNQQSKADPKLLKYPEYQYALKLAKNSNDTSVLNHWTNFTTKPYYNYIDSMVWKAYKGVDNEAYIDSANRYLFKTKDQRFNITLAYMFYEPMLELLKYLKENQFNIYVVSGSVRGVIWSVCPQIIGFNRDHLIGTNQILSPKYFPIEKRTQFIIAKGIFPPKDDKDGKSLNIYSQIGKVPVFAFGNTTGDFGMFRLASTSKYPNAAYLLNHNDSIREYAYPPYHGPTDTTWQRTMRLNGWKRVDMAQEFKTVWMTK
ncbi:MAG: haloacid dehalogenase-like hydrolase [Bacteroidales bacterium]|nr:haloacid dehalogenase-like hydrolase [Bacteroidales bacterium]